MTRAQTLRMELGLTPARADLVMCLYAAKGEIVSVGDILDHISWDSYDVGLEVVKVQVCLTRKAIGRACIENVWGQGYRLTPEGMAKVSAALSDSSLFNGEAA